MNLLRSLFLVLFLVILAVPVVALAQDAPAPAWEREDIILIGALFVVSVVVTVLSITLVVLLRPALQNNPLVADLIRSNSDRVVAELRRIAAETPNNIDDALVDYFDARIRQIFEEATNGTPVEPPQVE